MAMEPPVCEVDEPDDIDISAPVEVALPPTERLMPFSGVVSTILAPVPIEMPPVVPASEFPVDTKIRPVDSVPDAVKTLTEPDHSALEAPLFSVAEPPVSVLLLPPSIMTDPPWVAPLLPAIVVLPPLELLDNPALI